MILSFFFTLKSTFKLFFKYYLFCICFQNYMKPTYTLKNKGASRCHRRTFLSKWFHKEPLISEEPFCFTKASLWWKKVLQIIKRWDGSLKNLWLNGSLWNQKWFFYGIAVNFKSVRTKVTFLKKKNSLLCSSCLSSSLHTLVTNHSSYAIIIC